MPAFLRFIAGRVLRVNIMKYASLAEAERHLRRAAELEPRMVIYVADLANFLGRTGHPAEANEIARRLATLPSVHPMDDSVRAACLARWLVVTPRHQSPTATAR
jgi:hypothetical protein